MKYPSNLRRLIPNTSFFILGLMLLGGCIFFEEDPPITDNDVGIQKEQPNVTYPPELLDARAAYFKAYEDYTALVTEEGAAGNMEELLGTYRDAYGNYKVLLDKYNLNEKDLAVIKEPSDVGFLDVEGIDGIVDIKESPTNNGYTPLAIESIMDVKKAEKAAEEVEQAFANADVKAIVGFMGDAALARSKKDIENADPNRLKTFAKDFNTRIIRGYGDDFIEFEFDWNGIPYTVDFSRQEDGTFKILRL